MFLCAALLTVVAAIGGLAPTVLFSPHSGTDWPDDLGLTASVVPQSYRQGDGGAFSETEDTYISSGAADTNFGHGPKLLVDGSGCKVATGVMCKTLIKFPKFIGPDSGQVPPGATIVNANLQLVITNRGGREDLYQITQPWSEDNGTWNSFSPGGAPTTRPRESFVYPSVLGLFSIDVKSIVQRWVDGDANEGILLASDSTDGVDYESSESANPPTLTVQFSPAPPPMTIQIQDLGILPGMSGSEASAVNNAGQVIGVSYDSDYSAFHAFSWQSGSMTDLGVLPGDHGSWARDINDAGQVVGESQSSATNTHAILWANGSMMSLPTLGGTACSAFGINNGGQIVGTCTTDNSSLPHLVRWENGAITDLGTNGLSPRGINDDGKIVGDKYYGGSFHATIWDQGVLTDLGTLNGGPNSYGRDINHAGQVVGDNFGSPYHAFRWEDGTMTDMGTLQGGSMSTGNGINEAGQVVGYSTTTETGGAHAYLWSDGWMADLGDLGYGGSQAYDLNDAGLVVGSSVVSINGPSHAVLWTIASAPPRTIRDLGTLPGDAYSGAVKLNEVGQAVGWSVTESCYGHTDCSGLHGFLWGDGAMTDLGSLSGGTMATDINEASQVVGWSFNSSNFQRAFLWQAGAMTDLGVGNSTSAAMAINDAGQVAGWYNAYTGNPPYGWEIHVFLWQNGVTTDLGRVVDEDPGSPREMGVTGLNNNGQIVGWSRSVDLHACDTRAWLWQNGVFTDLTNTYGCRAMTESIAYDINDAGQIAAWRGSTYEGPNRAFLWENGGWTALLPSDAEGRAFGINNLGQIAAMNGSSAYSAGGPFISERSRTITALPDGFPPENVSAANDLNDAGQVVGWAVPEGSYTGQHAVMWTTAAPPSGPATLTFQKGDGGSYSETDDTYISSTQSNTNFGAGDVLYVDAAGCKTSPSTVCKALLKFPGFIGATDGQVTLGSTILSAFLQLEIINPGGTQLLRQVTEDWTESYATWDTFATPGSPGSKGAGISFNASLGMVTVNITGIVQNWVNGERNLGVLISSSSTDGVHYRSSESTNPPKLTVTFQRPPPLTEWVRQFDRGNYGYLDTSAVFADASGVYTVGSGGLLRKFDASGNLVWTRPAGGADVTVDGSAVYVTWNAGNGVNVRKWAVDGTELWTHQYGSPGNETVRGISAAASGVVLVGTSNCTSGNKWGDSCDAFVIQVDAAGNAAWRRDLGKPALATDVAATESAVYVVGNFGLPFWEQAFLRKYDSNGTELWTRQFGTDLQDMARSVFVQGSDIYVAGTFGTSPASEMGDAFVAKYDAEGTEQWTRVFGDPNQRDEGAGVSADASGVYVTGHTWGTLPGHRNWGSVDIIVRKYDPAGNELLTLQFGMESYDVARDLSVASSGVYLRGFTCSRLPVGLPDDMCDAFVMKLRTES